jgi:hypothetical protein
VTIKILEPEYKEKYSALVSRYGSVFNTFEWLSIYGNSIELYGIFNKDLKLIGAFHLYKTKVAGLVNYYKNPPFTPHIGLFYENTSNNRASQHSFEKGIIAALASDFNKRNFHLLTLAFPDEHHDMQAFIWNKYKVIPNYTYQLRLGPSEDELLKNLSSDKRNSLNKAVKDNVSVQFCEDTKLVREMVEMTYSRKAKKLNTAILDSILFTFSNSKNSFAYLAYIDDKPSAVSFCIHDENKAYYLLGGYNTKNKHQGAGVLALWNCILHAKKIGIKTFDFEGSMIPEVEKYFRGFGGDLIPYFTINKASFILESLLKFIKRESF